MAERFGESTLEAEPGAAGERAAAGWLFRRFGVYALVLAVIVALGGYPILAAVAGAGAAALLWAGLRD
ncbi:hypothetical protein [Nocardia sp. NPDC048505]|uniref:hypothetical protein n=1 Tax=unclassified Nocardia TaxID=2637762 RepID=UPI0033E21B1F